MAVAPSGSGAAAPVGIAVLVVGSLAGILMIAADFTPILQIEIKQSGTCEIVAEADLRALCSPTGGERHSYALVVLGVLSLVLAWVAGPGRARAAALGLVTVGLATLAMSLIGDLPAVGETGAIGIRFDEAAAKPAAGFFIELVAGGLAVGAGAARLMVGVPGG